MIVQNGEAHFRNQQPPMLFTWGKNDGIFTVEGAELYKRELPNAELHLLATGHFALEEEVDSDWVVDAWVSRPNNK